MSESPFRDAARRVFGSLADRLGGPIASIVSGFGAVLAVLFAPVDVLLSLAHLIGAPLLFLITAVFATVAPIANVVKLDPVVAASLTVLVVVRAMLVPFAVRAQRLAIKMAVYAPVLKRLQAAHADNKQAQQQAVMEFYAANGINPFGCVGWLAPGLLLIVAFYGVITALVVRSADGTFHPRGVPATSELAQHMSQLSYFTSWNMDLTKSLGDAGTCSRMMPYLIVVALLVVIGLVAYRLTPKQEGKGRLAAIMAILTVFVAIPLPAYVVILRCADALFIAVQSIVLSRMAESYRLTLASDPDVRRQVADMYVDVGAIIRKD